MQIDGKMMNHKQPGHGLWDTSGNFLYDEVVQLKGTPFVIKYEASAGAGAGSRDAVDEAIAAVRLHKDNADASFILLLSEPSDFEGGGTIFQALGTSPDDALPLEQGELIAFNGQLVHGAAAVTRGRRLVLSGFTTFDAEYTRMKRLGTLASIPCMY